LYKRSFNDCLEGLIMAQLVCEKVTRGLRESEVVATIRDIHGRREFLRVEKDFLYFENEKYYLPVGVVYEDKERNIALIELPQESEAGNQRLGVRSNDLLEHR
jgi:hypothetical protein